MKISKLLGWCFLSLSLFLMGCSSSSTESVTKDINQRSSNLLGDNENSQEDEQTRRKFQAQELKEELEIGRSMAAKLAGTKGVVKNRMITTQYLNLIVQTLARQAGRPEIEYSVGILRDEEPNAFATPGGYIFVTQGLLTQVKDEDELAGVLAHEVAHITEKHLFNEIKPKRNVSAGETLSRMMSRGGSNLGQGLSKIVNQGLKALIEDGLGQEKESQADQVGIMYAAAAGYDPNGLRRFLDRIGRMQKELKLGKTHPPFESRLKLYDEFVSSQKIDQTKTRTHKKILETRFQKGLGLSGQG
jgi:predicted Zn-dependent protease